MSIDSEAMTHHRFTYTELQELNEQKKIAIQQYITARDTKRELGKKLEQLFLHIDTLSPNLQEAIDTVRVAHGDLLIEYYCIDLDLYLLVASEAIQRYHSAREQYRKDTIDEVQTDCGSHQ